MITKVGWVILPVGMLVGVALSRQHRSAAKELMTVLKSEGVKTSVKFPGAKGVASLDDYLRFRKAGLDKKHREVARRFLWTYGVLYSYWLLLVYAWFTIICP